MRNDHNRRCVRFNAEGTQLLSGGDDRTVKLWGLKGIPSVRVILTGHTWYAISSYLRMREKVVEKDYFMIKTYLYLFSCL